LKTDISVWTLAVGVVRGGGTGRWAGLVRILSSGRGRGGRGWGVGAPRAWIGLEKPPVRDRGKFSEEKNMQKLRAKAINFVPHLSMSITYLGKQTRSKMVTFRKFYATGRIQCQKNISIQWHCAPIDEDDDRWPMTAQVLLMFLDKFACPHLNWCVNVFCFFSGYSRLC